MMNDGKHYCRAARALLHAFDELLIFIIKIYIDSIELVNLFNNNYLN